MMEMRFERSFQLNQSLDTATMVTNLKKISGESEVFMLFSEEILSLFAISWPHPVYKAHLVILTNRKKKKGKKSSGDKIATVFKQKMGLISVFLKPNSSTGVNV